VKGKRTQVISMFGVVGGDVQLGVSVKAFWGEGGRGLGEGEKSPKFRFSLFHLVGRGRGAQG